MSRWVAHTGREEGRVGWWGHLEVLGHQPAFERGEEQRGSDAPKEATQHEHIVVCGVLGDARRDVRHTVQQRRLLAPAAVQFVARKNRVSADAARNLTARTTVRSTFQLPFPRYEHPRLWPTLLIMNERPHRKTGRWKRLLSLLSRSHTVTNTYSLLSCSSSSVRDGEGAGVGVMGTHCLSAREPTIVPNTMELPKPAMKSLPMSPLE
jgi:hypothetical protein